MCTAATYKTKDFYMGRTLDYEFSYGDEVTVTPRNYPINFRFMGVRNNHYAMIGMAHVADDYPLYYEAFTILGSFISGTDNVLFKWAEFSEKASGRVLSTGAIVNEILKFPVTERDVEASKKLYILNFS